MNEIIKHEPASAGSTIVSAAQEMTSAGQLANGLCGTSFVPQHFRGKPEEAAAAIMYGSTLGMDPLTSLQQIYSIGGKPALYSRAMVAIVLSKGHQIWTVEDTPESVTVAGRRRGSDRVEQITWTIDRAKAAGYTSNKNYQKDPHAMLYARAAGDVARRIAPDALLGLAYSAEELELHGEPAVSAQRVKASASDFTTQREKPEHSTPSEAQVKKMRASLNEHIAPEMQRQFIAETVGREVETSKNLTRDEVSKIIDRLEQM